jgi:hypothetical protein
MAIWGFVAVMPVDQGFGSMHGHTELLPPYNSDYRSNQQALAARGDRSIASAFVRAETCYQAGFTWQMCFSVHNATADGEWLDLVRLTFPTALGAWSIACKSQNATDSAGYFVNLTCNVNPSKPDWYVPWIGTGGAICVGGGLNYQQGITRDTQCYDLALAQFNAPNADLGQLPELWWGMADGWSTHRGRHQIWIANGMDQNGTLLWASAYADRTTGGFVTGPIPAMDGDSSEGDGWNGQFYVLGGARYYPLSGIAPQVTNQTLVQCFDCGAHYYVAPAPMGNDNNPGNSPVSPLASVQTAENKAQSGVVDTGIIYVASGGYADTVVCDANQGLTIIGGWNANFTDITGSSRINSLELRGGAVTISDIIIQ